MLNVSFAIVCPTCSLDLFLKQTQSFIITLEAHYIRIYATGISLLFNLMPSQKSQGFIYSKTFQYKQLIVLLKSIFKLLPLETI